MAKVLLQCVKVGSKLRIRFHSFTDEDENVYFNAYNNNYNCQFPRSIRQEGRFYEIDANDISLVARGKSPFYTIKSRNIRIIEGDAPNIDAANAARASLQSGGKKSAEEVAETAARKRQKLEKIFAVQECVVCMTETPDQVFIPCAHQCVCASCYGMIRKSGKMSCPMCTRNIQDVVIAA